MTAIHTTKLYYNKNMWVVHGSVLLASHKQKLKDKWHSFFLLSSFQQARVPTVLCYNQQTEPSKSIQKYVSRHNRTTSDFWCDKLIQLLPSLQARLTLPKLTGKAVRAAFPSPGYFYLAYKQYSVQSHLTPLSLSLGLWTILCSALPLCFYLVWWQYVYSLPYCSLTCTGLASNVCSLTLPRSHFSLACRQYV